MHAGCLIRARISLTLVLFVLSAPSRATAEITFASLCAEMVDREAIARWPQSEYKCKQASSYDRQKVSPDQPGWFSNADHTQFIRTERNSGREERVMLDVDGPGAIVRFWLTAGNDKAGALRIYLDGNEEPTLVFSAFDLLAGSLKLEAPLIQPHPGYTPNGGGNTLYLPIPYSKHCKVTWEEKGNGARYYQINYRTYAVDTSVQTFTTDQLETSRKQIDEISHRLSSPPGFHPGRVVSLNEAISAGAVSSLELPAGSAAIQTLELRLETDDTKEIERALRSTSIKLEFDGERTVWCPATDFFGSGVGINELRSWYRTVNSDGTMRCYWVMPYAKTAHVTLRNGGTQPIRATLHATVSPWEWDDHSMHFHASWHYESGLKTPPERDWNFVSISGRGVYVGDSLALFNLVSTWYGEGDEKIWVDKESFPSHLGTGTEDYYGYSYAPKGIIQTPFINQVRIDEPMTQGHNVMSRTRHLDAIPFLQSLRFDMELIAWKPTTLTYAATTYWYAFPGAEQSIKPQPKEAELPIPTLAEIRAQEIAARPRKPHAIECEEMKLVRKSGDFPVSSQDMEPWGRERWSGGEHLIAKTVRMKEFIELEFPAKGSGTQEIVLYVTQASDYGILEFTVNGQPVGVTFDGYAEKVQPSETIRLGTFQPVDGKFVLRAEVTGANPKSNGPRYFFALDCVVLEPAP